MEAKKFERLNQLLATLDTEKKASLRKFDEVFGGYYLDNFFLTPEEINEMMLSKNSFITYWKVSDERSSFIAKKCESALKSTAYKKFVKDFTNWKSGYAMGELIGVKIQITIDKFSKTIVKYLADNRREYQGRGRKFNDSIKYGSGILLLKYEDNKKMCSKIIIDEKK